MLAFRTDSEFSVMLYLFADAALNILGDSSKILKNMEDYYYY